LNLPTIDELRALLRHEGGRLYWVAGRYAGKEAGCTRRDGRCVVKVGGRAGVLLLRYRVIWAIERGAWPDGELDHINCNPADDRLENLRVATSAQNKANRRKCSRNRAGVKGAIPHKNKFAAQIYLGGRSTHLGVFGSAEEAGAAYAAAARAAFGEFARSA
jgi:hypothetical protein